MPLLLTVISCLAAAISGQTPLILTNSSEKLDNVHSMGNWTSDIGKKPVRLVDRTGLCSGAVQVKISGSWQPVCEDFWSNRASLAICRELDCTEPMVSASTAVPESREHLPVGNRSVILNDTWGSFLPVLCDQGAWESCQVQSPACTSRSATKINCTEVYAIRLVDGGDPCAGRVELMDKGYWGTVCDDAWDLEDANVVCKQLGCGRAIKALEGSYFQKGKGPIHLDEVNCSGSELSLWECPAQRNHDCGHKEDASVVCSASLAPIGMQKKGFPGQLLLILCIVLAVLLLGSLTALAFIFLKVKGKYALPTTENHNQRTSTATLGGNNSYQEVSITISKEEAPKLSLQVGALPSKDSDSDSDSDYERYDFHTQPPVPLSTFYNSQKYRVTEDMVQQNRFRMPPLQEDPLPQLLIVTQGMTVSPVHLLEKVTVIVPPAGCLGPTTSWSSLLTWSWLAPRATLPDARLLASQNHLRHNSESSTSSGEDYCNSPRSKPPLFIFQGFSSERNILEAPPNLELAGSRATVLGSHSRTEDSSSTSSGECYENSGSSQAPPMASFVCPEPCTPAVTGGHEDDSSDEDYDDIGAS